MRTNIEIDDVLMKKAQKLTNIKTKKAIVEYALERLVAMENQKRFLPLWGKVTIDDEPYK